MRFEIAAQSIKGGRDYQEDTWTLRGPDGQDLAEAAASPKGALARDGALVLVADGMGGEGGGAEASHIIAEHFNTTFFAEAEKLPPQERLKMALDTANTALLAAKQSRPELKEKSGSTLIVGILQDKDLHFLSIGDSSIWRFRDEEIHRINVLHERAAEMDVRAAELDTDEAWDIVLNDTQRRSITAAVMGFPLEPQHRQIAVRGIQPGDVLVFASDGIETLTFEHLRRAVTTILPKRNAAGLALALVRMIERLGTEDQDNTTVVVVRALPDSDRTRILPAAGGQSAGAPAANGPSPSVPPKVPLARQAPAAAPSPAAPARPAAVGPWQRKPPATFPMTTVAAVLVLMVVGYAAYAFVRPMLWSQDAPPDPNRNAVATPPDRPTSSSSTSKDTGSKQSGIGPRSAIVKLPTPGANGPHERDEDALGIPKRRDSTRGPPLDLQPSQQTPSRDEPD